MFVATYGSPTAPAVILLHGAGVAGWMWAPVITRLAATRRVLVPDLPGHGASAAEPFDGVAATVSALADLLGDGAAVAGFSWGGQLALHLASEHPASVRSVSVISSLARPLPAAPVLDPMVKATLPLARHRWFARLQATSMGVPAAMMDDYIDTSVHVDPDALAAILAANNRFVLPRGWANYRGRVLVAYGSCEPRSVRGSATALHVSAAQSRLVEVIGAHHDIPFRVPDWLADALQSSV